MTDEGNLPPVAPRRTSDLDRNDPELARVVVEKTFPDPATRQWLLELIAGLLDVCASRPEAWSPALGARDSSAWRRWLPLADSALLARWSPGRCLPSQHSPKPCSIGRTWFR